MKSAGNPARFSALLGVRVRALILGFTPIFFGCQRKKARSQRLVGPSTGEKGGEMDVQE
jgi:hypothetical protein